MEGCDNTDALAALVFGRLPESARAELLVHLDGCDECRRLVAASLDDSPELTRGDSIGRYLLLERVGAGAMGLVFAAYDPQLDRRVALKMLRGDASEAQSARMRREAKALARLHHPNVVAVHDVVAERGQLFIAMEFVEGATLRSELSLSRAPQVTLRRMLAAGEGLAAAHRAGIVHRDFKPDNVLIGRDGQVRVSDFGTARLAPEEERCAAQDAPFATTLESLQTRGGTLVGTPAYMAPEQLRGERADAPADQFSFCVTLLEALTGQRPFAAASTAEQLAQMEARAHRQVMERAKLGPALRKLLDGGLSVEPSQRFESMDALLEALGGIVRPRRGRRGAVAAVVTCVVGALAFAAWSWQRSSARECSGGEGQLASVWGPSQRVTLRQALEANRAGSVEAMPRVFDALDGFAARFVATHRRVCERTLRREQSPALLDARMHCLEGALVEHKTLLELSHAGGENALSAEGLLSALAKLSSPERCASTLLYAASEREPRDRQAFTAGERALARIRALKGAGRFAQALRETNGFVAAHGEVAALAARGHLLQGELEDLAGDAPAAAARLREAVALAIRSGEDSVAVEALALLTQVFGHRLAKLEEAMAWFQLGLAVQRRHPAGTRGEAALELGAGVALQAASRLTEALKHFERSLELSRAGVEPTFEADLLTRMAYVLRELARHEEARAMLRRALALREGVLGPSHPELALTLNQLGAVEQLLGHLEDAEALHQRALVLHERSRGPDDLQVGYSVNFLGNLYGRRREWERALGMYRRAVQIGEQRLGIRHPETGMAHHNVAYALWNLGQYARAEKEVRTTLSILDEAYPGAHAYKGLAQGTLGEILLRTGQAQAATAAFEASRTHYEKTVGPAHPGLASAFGGMGRAELAQGRLDPAVALLEKAWTLASAGSGVEDRGEHLTRLVEVLLRRGSAADRERARTVVTRAQEDGVEDADVLAALRQRVRAP